MLYVPTPEGLACPHRVYPMRDPHKDWSSVETKGINGNKHLPITYRHHRVSNLINILLLHHKLVLAKTGCFLKPTNWFNLKSEYIAMLTEVH